MIRFLFVRGSRLVQQQAQIHILPFQTGVLPKKGELSELECRYEAYISRPGIDGWELRKAMDELHAMDAVPSPPLVIAALRACRRIGDYALAVRILEAVKFKCGHKVNEIWPYMLLEIKPTLDELGVETPEELGYDKPELWLSEEDLHP